MRYMLIIASNPESYVGMSEAETGAIFQEYMEFTQRIAASGELVSGDPLQGLETATTVRVVDGKRTTTDGPFAETKEVLVGYYVVEVPTLDRALELAAEIPDARYGGVEVRPVMDVPMPA